MCSVDLLLAGLVNFRLHIIMRKVELLAHRFDSSDTFAVGKLIKDSGVQDRGDIRRPLLLGLRLHLSYMA